MISTLFYVIPQRTQLSIYRYGEILGSILHVISELPSFEPSSKSKMQNQANQPPPGYPAENPPPAPAGKKKMKCRPRTKAKGDRGFIEGCLWGLCCCWLCEVCFD